MNRIFGIEKEQLEVTTNGDVDSKVNLVRNKLPLNYKDVDIQLSEYTVICSCRKTDCYGFKNCENTSSNMNVV